MCFVKHMKFKNVMCSIFLTREKLEDCQKLELRLLDSRSNQESTVQSKLHSKQKPSIMDYKQRPFQFDESRRNRESRRNNRESSLDSFYSFTALFKSKLTQSRFSILARIENRGCVNSLLNSTVKE